MFRSTRRVASRRVVASPYTRNTEFFIFFPPVLFQLPRTEQAPAVSRFPVLISPFARRVSRKWKKKRKDRDDRLATRDGGIRSEREGLSLKRAAGGSRRPPRVLIKTKRRIKIPRSRGTRPRNPVALIDSGEPLCPISLWFSGVLVYDTRRTEP